MDGIEKTVFEISFLVSGLKQQIGKKCEYCAGYIYDPWPQSSWAKKLNILCHFVEYIKHIRFCFCAQFMPGMDKYLFIISIDINNRINAKATAN